MRVYHTVAPLDPGLEPPGLPPIALLELADFGQPPVPEFGNHHRLTAAAPDLRCLLTAGSRIPGILDVLPPGFDALVHVGEGPGRPAGEGLDPVLPFPVVIRHGVIVVEVFDVGYHV